MYALIVGGRNEVRGNNPVSGPATDKECSGQDLKRAVSSSVE
jgi:hypothetical protein